MSAVRVRMFRQGLGDCFLLTFPGTERPVHMLIDCGVLLGTGDAKVRMQTIAQHILDATGGTLDVLVVTHEHWDHLSGFEQARDLLGPEKLTIGEVWLGWTDKPGDPIAATLQERRTRALKRVVGAANKLAGVAEFGARRTAERLENLLEFWGGLGVAGQRGTHAALEWVRNRTAPRTPQYLEPGGEPLRLPGVEGLRIYVLGPPRDLKRLRKSDPSARDTEVYELADAESTDTAFFAALDTDAQDAWVEGQPFEEWFRVGEADAKERPFFQEHYGFEGEDWRRIEHDWLGVTGRLALQLDSDTNNTSLVLAFELIASGRVLLFPGDAQVGNWLSWHEGIEWKVEDGGKQRTVTAKDLLERTVLYKVSHHGSHNATLREKGLEMMTSDALTAMIPVNRASARKMKWDMPFPTLFGRLEERCRGRILDLEKGVVSGAPGAAPPDWGRFPGRAEAAEDWLDLHIDL
jgi:beta-lactamase superfamily II metal-dependent hydrolase